jgi:ElaB/YqjD/DUF883 family membrane-anchored ribosome-binding protein
MNTTNGNTYSTTGNSTIDGTLSKAASSVHSAVDSVAASADQAARNAKPAIDRVAAMAHQAVDKAAGAAAPTADWLAEHGESLKASQKKLVSDTCTYVSANPLKAVAIAAVAGFLISRFVI